MVRLFRWVIDLLLLLFFPALLSSNHNCFIHLFIILLLLLLFSECILPGSVFWGLWTRKDNSLNYYRAFIQKITASSINFLLHVDNNLRRTYNRTEPVLVVDKIPKMKEISVNSSVIAVHISGRTQWYRAGHVTDTNEPSSLAKVRFKKGNKRWVPLKELRLVKRPKFCVDRVWDTI